MGITAKDVQGQLIDLSRTTNIHKDINKNNVETYIFKQEYWWFIYKCSYEAGIWYALVPIYCVLSKFAEQVQSYEEGTKGNEKCVFYVCMCVLWKV